MRKGGTLVLLVASSCKPSPVRAARTPLLLSYARPFGLREPSLQLRTTCSSPSCCCSSSAPPTPPSLHFSPFADPSNAHTSMHAPSPPLSVATPSLVLSSPLEHAPPATCSSASTLSSSSFIGSGSSGTNTPPSFSPPTPPPPPSPKHNRPVGLVEKALAAAMTHLTKKTIPQQFLQNVRNNPTLLRQLAVPSHVLKSKVLPEIKLETEKIVKENQNLVSDKQSAGFLQMSAVLLAGYRVLYPIVNDHAVLIDILKECFVQEKGRNQLKKACMEVPLFAPNPLPVLSASFKKRARILGNSFSIEIEEDPQQEYYVAMLVKKCFFHSFCQQNQAAFLTPLLCQWGQDWKSIVDSQKHNLRVDTPTSLRVAGDKYCTYEFKRVQTFKGDFKRAFDQLL
ncbi:hypothetical protein QOT17_000536 [Balamuthia mandrillaris]